MIGLQPLTVYRKAAGSIVDGVWRRGAESDFTIQGVIQPLTNKDLELLPEGERVPNQRKLYTTSTLLSADPDTAQEPDQVLYNGQRWQVQGDQYYDPITGGDLWHHRYRLVAIAPDETERT
jgi:hypothetical protein